MIAAGMPAIPAYLAATRDETGTALKAEKGDAAASRAVAAFTTNAPGITSADQLLKDYRSLSVVLGAFGMSGMMGQTAILRKLMTQDPADKTSLAASSGNVLWQRFAQQMSSWSSTSTPFTASGSVAAIADQYLVGQYETKQGKAVPGLADALYFTRTGSGITSINALMSDPTSLKVVETTLGLDPQQFGALDFEEQQRILTQQVKLSSFATPAGLQRMSEQYLALTAENPPSDPQPATIASLFTSGDDSNDLMGVIGAALSVSA